MFNIRRKFIISSFLLSLTSIGFAASPDYACSNSDVTHMKQAILRYVIKNTLIAADDVEVKSEKCIGYHATAVVHPIKSETDDAKAYLRKDNHDWRVIAFGTDFDEKLLAKFPKE